MHHDPVTPLLIALAVMLPAAKLGGDLAMRLRQPAVLGELLAGIVLGNLGLVGFDALDWMKEDTSVDIVSRLAVVILLFQVGLESTVGQMMKVGFPSLVVATLGVIAPSLLGYFVSVWLQPEAGFYVHLFIGAILCATSVGITARVLQDLGKSQTNEARIILGAAVIDDVMGLVVLAVVSGLITAADGGASFRVVDGLIILGKAIAFLVGAMVLGMFLSKRVFKIGARLRPPGVLLALGLAFCFLLSVLASAIGLAPIVGAFAAGLILEDVHYRDYVDRGEHALEDLMHPIGQFLIPIFFIVMGMRTDLRAFADVHVLGFAAALTAAAILGKQVCGLGVWGKNIDRLTVGIGMVPRGEVGLIFASIGAALTLGGAKVVDAETYAAVVIMVVVTTVVTPVALKWSTSRIKS